MLITYTAEKEYQALILSSADIQPGQTYTLVCGETETEIVMEKEKMVTNVGNASQMNGKGSGHGGGGRGNRSGIFKENNGEVPTMPSGDKPVKPSGAPDREAPVKPNGEIPAMPSEEPSTIS